MNVLNQNPTEEAQALRQALKNEFGDEEYRYAYAESFLNTRLASQIKTIRQQRQLTQVEIAQIMGIKQSGYARFEDVNHSVWKTDTLWKIARALGVRVNISLESFGTLIEDKLRFSRADLEKPSFDQDPLLHETEQDRVEAIAELRKALANAASVGEALRDTPRKDPAMEKLAAATNPLAPLDSAWDVLESEHSGTGDISESTLGHIAATDTLRRSADLGAKVVSIRSFRGRSRPKRHTHGRTTQEYRARTGRRARA